MRKAIIANVVATVFIGGLLAPAAFRLAPAFVNGTVARLPFFILPLYLSPVLWVSQSSLRWFVQGGIAGFAVYLPLALWSTTPT
jgi:hypothetical protein